VVLGGFFSLWGGWFFFFFFFSGKDEILFLKNL